MEEAMKGYAMLGIGKTESAGKDNYARSFFVFFEECLSLLNSNGTHLRFQFFEIFVHYFAGFIVADSRLITF